MKNFHLGTAGMLICLAFTFCMKKQEEKPKDEQAELPVQESLFLSQADSVKWLNYLNTASEDTALAYLLLGELYLANNKPDSALGYFETAVSYNPDRAITYLNIGCAYNGMGEYDKAEEAFHKFIEKAPGSIMSQEIFRIVEKYRSIESETEIP
ncbi:MAG TPA: tetratricopeptide repeat protein [archaeon]|nr:tetratricopeptide repeat protein [archaeon]